MIIKKIWDDTVDNVLFTFDILTKRTYWSVVTIKVPIAGFNMGAFSSWLDQEIGLFKYDLRSFIIDDLQISHITIGFRRKEDAVYTKLVWG